MHVTDALFGFASAFVQQTAVGFECDMKWQSLQLFLFVPLTKLWRDGFWQRFVLKPTSLTSDMIADHQPRRGRVAERKRAKKWKFLRVPLSGVSDWIAGSCQVLCHRWMSAGPEIQRSDQHLAPLFHPLSSVAGQHLFIATRSQSQNPGSPPSCLEISFLEKMISLKMIDTVTNVYN